MSENTGSSTPQKDPRLVKTPKALFCFVTLVKPRAMEPGKEPEYSVNLLWPKTQNLDAVKKAIIAAAVEEFGPNAVKLLVPGGKLDNPLRDGDQKFAESPEKYAAFKDKFYINAKSRQRVGIVDANRAPVDPGEVYSGCFGHASLRFYGYDWQGKRKGVGCGLQALMLVNKGPRLDGREDAASAFKEFEPDTSAVDGEIDDIMGDDIPF